MPGRGIPGGIPPPIGSEVFLTKRDFTTGSGGFEYAAGSMTSVLAYKMLKTLALSCRVAYADWALYLPERGRVMGMSPR